jgi:transglutaminase-like putative cysteine protease
MSPPGSHLGSVGRQVAAEGGVPPRPAPAWAKRHVAVARGEEARASWLRLAAFFGLAAFAAGHWVALVEAPSTGRTLLVVVVATLGAAALIALGAPGVRKDLTGRVGERPRAAGAVIVAGALLIGLAAIVMGLGAAGLPLRLLAPERWGELFDGLDRGLAGVQSVTWPYDGPDEWVRLTILLGAPLLLGLAALLAFFPARRARPLFTGLGLVMLLLAYGTAVTEHDPGAPLMRGLALLLLVGAWLWLPRVSAREAALAASAVVAVGVLSLPVAAALDGDRAWWNYRAWNLFGSDKTVTFDWTHEYGPLEWPRDGTTLLNVESDSRQYWKAETLDRFDGFRWTSSRLNEVSSAPEGLPESRQPEGRTWDYFEWNPRWDKELRFSIRALSSNLLVGAGTTYFVQGTTYQLASEGTITKTGEPLQEGDSYMVRAYVPTPSARQMREAPDGYPSSLSGYTRIELPGRDESAQEPVDDITLRQRQQVIVPLRGSNATYGDPGAPARLISRSQYGRMYAIAKRETAGAQSTYDAVMNVERYLNDRFSYLERTPPARNPLNAFMFRDGFGYCQQFSGTMALMLRMLGIPSRVAAGFAPGSFNRDTGEYRVRDLDAHSWVEVYFNGIGWVAFDPTPAASPADSQAADLAPTSPSAAGTINGSRGGVAADRLSDTTGSSSAGDDGGIPAILLLPLALLVLVVLAGGLVAWLALERRGQSAEALAEAQLLELRRALSALSWNVPASTTLLALERRLLRSVGPHAAGYARRLREHRYDPRRPDGPGPRERRALRRELTARRGLSGRLRGMVAVPPGGPRPV